MNEQPRSAVVFKDDKPYFELTANELVFRIETPNSQAPIYFHMAPYSFDGIKAALQSIRPKIKEAGKTIISEDGDNASLIPLFDETFQGMSNVKLKAADAEPPSVEQQKALLDRNPRVKARVINEGFCTVFIVRKGSDELVEGVSANGRQTDQPVVLEDLFSVDSETGVRTEYFYRLHSLESDKSVLVFIGHQFDVETTRDYNLYDRASRREIDKASGFTSIAVDHDMLDKLYNRTILRLDGCLINGEPCTESNKAKWIQRVPYYMKKIALDARFEDVTKKNG